MGTLIEIGMDKMQISQIEKLFEIKDRAMAGHTAPSQGLFLDRVYYP